MADPDVFDVPWAGDEPHPIELGDLVPASWSRRVSGPWQAAAPAGAGLPPAGWKLHVGSTVADAESVLRTVARTCVEHEVAFKALRGRRLVRAGHLKYSPRSLSGKAATAYPVDEARLTVLVDALAAALRGVPAPTIPGEVNHPAAPLGLRWGAFSEQWVEAPDGRTVPGVRDPGSGTARPDDRACGAPALPSALQARFAGPPDEPLPVVDVSVLHRSNAGGVYRARLAADGRPVVLKEARHHTGLDGHDVDAVTRLHHEREALEALAGSGVAPALVDVWPRADADFLVVEHVDGPNLATVIGRRHPGGIPWSTPADREVFDGWAAEVVSSLRELVARMRERGVVHGDLQPANVVVGPQGLRLVDFEGAVVAGRAVTGAIGTPGYVPPSGETRDRDTFAVDRVALVLSDPDALLLDRRPDLEQQLGDRGRPPDADLDRWRHRLVDGILARTTPQRQDRLFPGGIEQFTRPLGGHDLASGAAGVLLALAASGVEPDPAHVDWLAALPVRAAGCRGLLEGVDGIALALARLGRPADAARLAAALLEDLPRDLSWSRGRAGVCAALAELATRLDDPGVRARARACTADLAAEVLDPDAPPRSPGLLGGWAGVALGLLRAGELLGVDVVDAARAAVLRETAGLERRGDCLVALPGGRVRTGLAHGGAAALLCLAALGPDPGAGLEAARDALARTVRRAPAPVAGLFDGLAGEVVALATVAPPADVSARQDRCTWHCVPTRRGWSVLGAQRLRCSDDLATGSAGVLLALSPEPAAALAEVLCLPRALASRADVVRGSDEA